MCSCFQYAELLIRWAHLLKVNNRVNALDIFNEGTDDADFTVLRDYAVNTALIRVIRAFILSNL